MPNAYGCQEIIGSRPLKSCKGDTTRPTADKVKGAVFSSLGGSFDSGRMLDCYSGTGNMALEALSRGMKFATMVEKDRMALNVIRENVKSLQEKNCEIISGSIFSVMNRLKEAYDLVYIDPPYKEEKNVELIEKLIVIFDKYKWNGRSGKFGLNKHFQNRSQHYQNKKKKCMVLPRSHIIESRNNNENSSLLWNI